MKKHSSKTPLGAAALLLALAGFALPAFSQETLADGEVRKVDKANGKLTLRHGEIKNLDMPPMTMVFAVRDPALLDQLKPGDKVQFQVVDEAGKLTVTEIRPVN